METKEIEHYFANSTVLQENDEETEELIDLAGYQVTKAELFAHTREPAITIWDREAVSEERLPLPSCTTRCLQRQKEHGSEQPATV